MSGLFDKYPNLQIISGHWGELVPFYLNRLDDQQAKTLQLKRTFKDYFKQNIYITPSGFFNENQLHIVSTKSVPTELFILQIILS